MLHARERFMREGFLGITVDDLVRDLAMSKKTFYRVFTSKEDLVEQTARDLLLTTAGSVKVIVAGGGSFIDKTLSLMSFLATVYSLVESPMVRELQRHLPHVWMLVEDFRGRQITENFSILIRQGIGEGFVRPNVNVRLFALVLVSAVQGIVRPSRLAEESFSARDAMEGILDMLFRGILTPEGHEAFSSLQSAHQSHPR